VYAEKSDSNVLVMQGPSDLFSGVLERKSPEEKEQDLYSLPPAASTLIDARMPNYDSRHAHARVSANKACLGSKTDMTASARRRSASFS